MISFKHMGSVSDVLAALKGNETIRDHRVDAVWLFGSHVSGAAGPKSDVDLAVLCEPPLKLTDRTFLMDRIARAVGSDVDIVDLKTAHPALAWEVVTTGRILFERDPETVERFVRLARYAAEDSEQRDRMVLLATVPSIGGHR